MTALPRPFRKVGDGLRLMRRLAGALRPHARGQGGALAVMVLFSLLMVALRIAQPVPLKWIIDFITNSPEAVPAFVPKGDWTPLLLSGAYLALSLGAAGVEYGHMLVVLGLVNRVTYAFREQIYFHVLRLPLTFHEKLEVGDLLTRIVSDAARLRRGLAGLALRGFRSVLLFLSAVAAMVWIDPVLSLVTLVCGLGAGAMMVFRGRLILFTARKNRRKEGLLASAVEESLQGIREIQTYRPEGAADPRFLRLNAKSLKSEQKLRKLEAGLLFRVEAILGLALCLVVWIGTRHVTEGRLTAGGLVMFLTYLLHLYAPFTQFARQASQTGRTLACGERLVKVVEREPEVCDRPGAVEVGPVSGTFAFEGVSLEAPKQRRGSRKTLLSDATFSVEPGMRVAILGSNGAGKSTLLRLGIRLTDPGAGQITLDGRDLRDYTIASLRRQFSVVYQEAALFGLTVRENIAAGRPGAGEEEIRRAAERARITDMIEALPLKYDTVVRKRGRLFSGGERQKLALARAILRDGRLWLLDEPTTSLDAAAASQLQEALLEATAGRTTLWVTHDYPLACRLDRILLLDAGTVKFYGPPGEFTVFARSLRGPFLQSLVGGNVTLGEPP